MKRRKILLILCLAITIGFACSRSAPVTSQNPAPTIPDTKQAEPVSVITVLKSAFQERNTKIETVRIVDTKPPYPGAPHHLVIGWGIRKDLRFTGQFDDELFGLFLMNADLTKIEKTLDVFATPRWFDYQIRIESSTIDQVTIVGKGGTYSDSKMRRTYQLGLEQ